MNYPTHLRFDTGSGRWCIGERELHCGDVFALFPDRPDLPPIHVRIEHGGLQQDWYLITPYGITELSMRKAQIQPS